MASRKPKLVRRGQLKPHGDPAKIPCAIGMDLSLILSGGKLGDIEPLTTLLQASVDQLIRTLEARGTEVYIRTGLVAPVHHEVLLTLIPRRVHYEQGGRQICKTPFVSPKNLTTNDRKVTCRLCRKLRGLDDPSSRDEG